MSKVPQCKAISVRLGAVPDSVRSCILVVGAAAMLCAAAFGRADGVIAAAEESANSPVRSLAATCAGCHGSDGVGTPDSSIPSIAGLPPERFIEQMRAFRAGEGNPTVMRQIASGYSAEQTRALAAYFASAAKR